MYKKMTLEKFKELKEALPEDMDLWLTDEAMDALKVTICSEHLKNFKDILYREFLDENPSFLDLV